MQRGAVIRRSEFEWEERQGCFISCPVNPKKGSDVITGLVVQIPPGGLWKNVDYPECDVIGVVFDGDGLLRVDEDPIQLEKASAFYMPVGKTFEITSTTHRTLTVYLWISPVPEDVKHYVSAKFFSSLWNDETVYIPRDSANALPAEKSARMNFVFWPGTGSPYLCLHCGIQEPGETFNVHVHPQSEELFMIFEGIGQVHLDGQWIDVEPGDLLYAPPGIWHGTRNPHTGPNAQRYVTCGGPVPYDVVFYEQAGVAQYISH